MAPANNDVLLSIVVIFHNMKREAARTLYSLGPTYQNDMSGGEYEVIAIDNGSSEPLDAADVEEIGPNFSYYFHETTSQSPASAVNFGARVARGKYLAIVVDGARMVTPGVVRDTLKALQKFDDPFVCTLGWHLGPDIQNKSMLLGYNQAEEDQLLTSIDWRNDGYRLFEIAVLAQSSLVGLWGGMPLECSWFAMLSSVFFQVDGFDERFQSPGGGLVNHTFLNRLAIRNSLVSVVLLGQGSFHQFHGGVASNVKMEDHPLSRFKEEYHDIFGEKFQNLPLPEPYYFGNVLPSAMQFVNPKLPS